MDAQHTFRPQVQHQTVGGEPSGNPITIAQYSLSLGKNMGANNDNNTTATPVELGSSRAYFETINIDVAESAVVNPYGTSETASRPRDPRDAYAQLRGLLQDVANDLGEVFSVMSGPRPEAVEISFGLVFSSEANAWVFKSAGEVSLNATLTWSIKA